MLLDELVRVIETIRTRIEQHGDSLRENETRTRMALIDPLLSALGWDTADPALVTPEYSVGNRRADYALLDGQSSPVVFLEAKRLGESLSNHRSQVVAYASELGIRYPALTNGDVWGVYDNSQLVPIEQRRILDVSIMKHPPAQTALKLLLLWRPNIASGEPVAANEPVLSAEPVAQDSKAQAGAASPTPRPETAKPLSVAQAVPGVPPMEEPGIPTNDWIRLSDFFPETHDKAPSEIRFSDGKEYPMASLGWWRLVEKTAIWLWSKNYLTIDKVPVNSSPRRYIVNIERTHPSGKSFNAKKLINDTPLYTDGNVDCKAATANAKKLLTHCGQDPSSVWVKPG